ncbi:TPA: radical SAM protein [Vibrio parahaemolyticus]|nr:radical SAM protein [Vibrio parahaemolyticus]
MENTFQTNLEGLTDKESQFLSKMYNSKIMAKLKLELKKPEEIFTDDELETYNKLLDNRKIIEKSRFKSHSFLIMKATRLCNLRCTYCHSWREGKGNTMPFEILAKTIRDVLSAKDVKRVDFIWHGGEVTLLKPSYIKKALWLQSHFKQNGQIITNSIQTNATNLSKEWLNLLYDFDFEVGVSIDGPKELHDRYRLKKNGTGSFDSVKTGINKLREKGIPFGALAVINEDALNIGAKDYLDFLISMDLDGVALLNAIPEEYHPKEGESYLPWQRFVNFLHEMFKVWWDDYRNTINIRELNGLVENAKNKKPTVCEFAGDCMGQFLTIEPNGIVSACDKYIGDKTHQFGDLHTETLSELLKNSLNLDLAIDKANKGVSKMTDCEYYKICRGGCPHDVQLNMQNSEGWKGTCCGMKALMSEIQAAVNKDVINYINL